MSSHQSLARWGATELGELIATFPHDIVSMVTDHLFIYVILTDGSLWRVTEDGTKEELTQ